MKKLLAPLVGLTTVATLVTPLATSCTTSEASVKHVKSSPVDEITPKDGIAQYVLVLDRNDYDANGFKVVVKVADNDKTGAKSQEFAATWIVDGDHLIVNVEYLLTGEEVLEEDATVKLNLVVNYGSEWKETVAVKFAYVAIKGINLIYNSTTKKFELQNFKFLKGSSYTFRVEFKQLEELGVSSWGWDIFDTGYNLGFQDIKVYLNGKEIIQGDNTFEFYYNADDQPYAIGFEEAMYESWQYNDVLVFEVINCQASEECPISFINS